MKSGKKNKSMPDLTKEISEVGSQSRTVLSIVLTKNRLNANQRQQTKAVRKMMTRLLSNMYCLLLILFGIIFPLSEALQDYWHKSHYNGIFVIYIYLVATAFLLLLQIYLIPISKKESHSTELRMPTSASTSHPFNLPNSYPGELNHSSSCPGGLGSSVVTNTDGDDLVRFSLANSTSELSTIITTDDSHVVIDLDQKLNENLEHSGSSFYLRLGALVFGLGNMIYIGLEIAYLITVPEVCASNFYSWTFVLRLIFVIIQTYFLFKNTDVQVTVHVALAHFGFKHLIATNLCIWIRTLVHEILVHMQHVADHSVHAAEDVNVVGFDSVAVAYIPLAETNNSGVDCDEYREVLNSASPYLFPFVLEYSLIAAGILAIMSQGIGKKKSTEHVIKTLTHAMSKHGPKSPNTSRTKEGEQQDDEEDDDTDFLQNYAGPMHTHSTQIDLASSNKGMFIGFLCVGATLLATFLFFNNLSSGNDLEAQLCYLVTEISLEVLMLAASCSSLYSLDKLSLQLKPLGVDDILLFIALAGSFLFQISILLSNAFFLSNLSNSDFESDNEYNTDLVILSLTASLLASVQIVIQTILIISGLRRYTSTAQQLAAKPGREAITFLVVANVTMWLFGMTQIKNLELGLQEEFYGLTAWLIIMNLNLPMYLFFRFHSSVCLADIRSHGYAGKIVEAKRQKHASGSQQGLTASFSNAAFSPTPGEVTFQVAGDSDILKQEL